MKHIFIKDDARLKSSEIVTARKAKKTHFCDECNKEIPKGTEYIEDKFRYGSDWSFFEDYWHIHRVCMACWKGDKLVAKDKSFKVIVKNFHNKL